MKRTLIALAAVLATLFAAAPANGAAYSADGRIGAHLEATRYCAAGATTAYDVMLINNTRIRRVFTAVEVQGGVVVARLKQRVPRHSGTGISVLVPAGEQVAVTITHRGEVVMHRRLSGICY